MNRSTEHVDYGTMIIRILAYVLVMCCASGWDYPWLMRILITIAAIVSWLN